MSDSDGEVANTTLPPDDGGGGRPPHHLTSPASICVSSCMRITVLILTLEEISLSYLLKKRRRAKIPLRFRLYTRKTRKSHRQCAHVPLVCEAHNLSGSLYCIYPRRRRAPPPGPLHQCPHQTGWCVGWSFSLPTVVAAHHAVTSTTSSRRPSTMAARATSQAGRARRAPRRQARGRPRARVGAARTSSQPAARRIGGGRGTAARRAAAGRRRGYSSTAARW